MTASIDGHLLLLHGFEERALCFRRRAIHFVCKHQLRKDRAALEFEAAAGAIKDRDADDVGRKQVAGELNALVSESQRLRESVGEGGLADSGNVLDEQMAACQQARHAEANLGILAQDHAIELIQSRAQSFAGQGATVKDAIIVAIGNLQHQVATGSVLAARPAARIAQSGPGTPTFISVFPAARSGWPTEQAPA